ncbi:hypothetical protein, partial [Neisseria sicca]|uniref:hypothetical protein n=1 Tax=Neisseria sicca TaxID=490 RepID=UPI0011BD05AC
MAEEGEEEEMGEGMVMGRWEGYVEEVEGGMKGVMERMGGGEMMEGWVGKRGGIEELKEEVERGVKKRGGVVVRGETGWGFEMVGGYLEK